MKAVFLLLILTLSACDCKCQNHSNSFQNAELIGGVDSLYKAIIKETILDEDCKEGGKVYVDYIVKKDGEIGEVSLAKGLCPVADSIAIQIIRRLKYNPAMRNGQACVSRKSLPIYFTK